MDAVMDWCRPTNNDEESVSLQCVLTDAGQSSALQSCKEATRDGLAGTTASEDGPSAHSLSKDSS